MAETIESFVNKLRTEGIQQGKQDAEQIKEEASKEVDQLLADARAQADKIIADANSQAEGIMSRSHTELELACRDAVLKLRESLQEALQAVLFVPIEKYLNDDSFLKELIHTTMDQFLSAAMSSSALVRVNVTPEMHTKLFDWSRNELRNCCQNRTSGFDFRDNLGQAGFEFTVLPGATIEISQDSVLETLMSLVGPDLRNTISHVMEEK